MSKAKKVRDGSAGPQGRVTRIEAASGDGAGPPTSSGHGQMNASQIESDDRVIRARQRISEGFYDRDDVRRAIAEALMFVLSARRD